MPAAIRLASLAAAAFLLAACHGKEDAEARASTTVPAEGAAPAASQVTPTAVRGHYTIAGTTVALSSALRLPDEDGKLRLLLTPDALSAEEQATILGESWTGLSLLSKRTERYPDRYPFVIVELRTDGGVSATQVKHFYVMASGIAVPNHTDNINRSGATHGVEHLQLREGRLQLRASGQEEIGGEPRSWSFDVEA